MGKIHYGATWAEVEIEYAQVRGRPRSSAAQELGGPGSRAAQELGGGGQPGQVRGRATWAAYVKI